VLRLLLLAADNTSDNEAANAALSAARLFKSSGLKLVEGDPASVTCIMCQPATQVGHCYRCGFDGDGPGHACRRPEPGTLCRIHATWREGPPEASPFGYQPSAPPAYVAPPFAEYLAREQRSLEVIVLREQLGAALARIAELEGELARIRGESGGESSDASPRKLGGGGANHARWCGTESCDGSCIEVPDDDLLLTIDALELSTRATTCLARSDVLIQGCPRRVRYVGDLVRCTVEDLLRVKNMGRKTVQEIRSTLRAMNLDLGMEVADWEDRLERWRAARGDAA